MQDETLWCVYNGANTIVAECPYTKDTGLQCSMKHIDSIPERPRAQRFSSRDEAVKYSGYSSQSLVAYVQGELAFVTPGAYADYVEKEDWPSLHGRVKTLIDDLGQEGAAEALFDQLRDDSLVKAASRAEI